MDEVDSKLCFELIHDAFDLAYRNNSKNHEIDKIIFYHIHNPSVFEHLNFIRNFPGSKILYLVRNPPNDRVVAFRRSEFIKTKSKFF